MFGADKRHFASRTCKMPLKNEYGITAVTLDEDFRKEMEPGAAPMEDRISALEALSKQGCYTWISIEPYPTPKYS